MGFFKIGKNQDIPVMVKHIEGLNLPENASCMLTCGIENIKITSGNNIINLPVEKITSVSLINTKDVIHQASSSLGGAIIGGAIAGVAGAAIGGRSKDKKITVKEKLLAIMYNSNGETKHIYFSGGDQLRINQIINRYGSSTNEVTL